MSHITIHSQTEGASENGDIDTHWLETIKDHEDIEGAMLLTDDGRIVNSTMDKEDTNMYAELAEQLADKARTIVRDLKSDQDLKFLRIVSKQREIILTSEENEFLLVIVQARIPKSESTLDEK